MAKTTKYLIVGAGISGLALANFLDSDDYLILEREPEIGGWCKTIVKEGFVWDFSGHFFHFRDPEIEAYLRARMPTDDEVVTVVRDSRIYYQGTELDFPFQKNIHQLPHDEFIECLYDLYFREEHLETPKDEVDLTSFKGMLYEKFGAELQRSSSFHTTKNSMHVTSTCLIVRPWADSSLTRTWPRSCATCATQITALTTPRSAIPSKARSCMSTRSQRISLKTTSYSTQAYKALILRAKQQQRRQAKRFNLNISYHLLRLINC